MTPLQQSLGWCRISPVKHIETMVEEIEVVEEYKRWLSVPWGHARARVARARKLGEQIRTARYMFEFRGGQ